jgi:hypothetical protein
MSINNIALSDLIVTEWYGNTALIPGAEGTPAAKQPAAKQPAAAQPAAAQPVAEQPVGPSTYKFLGKNNRRVSIIVDSPGAAFLPDPQLDFLTKILEACRMNIGDVAIINHHATPVVINALRQQLQPQRILLFGVEPTAIRLPINFPEFKLQPYDQCTYLSAPPLHQLVSNTADAKLLKSKLWVSLKTLFDV